MVDQAGQGYASSVDFGPIGSMETNPDNAPSNQTAGSVSLRSGSDTAVSSHKLSDRGSVGNGSPNSSPSRGRQTTTTTYCDTRFQLDPRAGLKAFRLIGGFDGITLDEFRLAVIKVQDEHVRATLMKNLDELFSTYDVDCDGQLDVLEFGNLVQSSTIAQQAVYHLLDQAEYEERSGILDEELTATRGDGTYIDFISVSLTILYMVCLAVQSDHEPLWVGWHIFELVFLIAFSMDAASRCAILVISRRYPSRIAAMREYVVAPMNFTDLALTVLGWIEVSIVLSNMERSNEDFVANLRWVRIFRVMRCGRLIRVFWLNKELRGLIEGIVSGFRSAVWSLALVLLIVFVWTIFLRTALVTDWPKDSSTVLLETLSNTPETMLIVLRCMALSSDGSCSEQNSKSLFVLLSDHFGVTFDILWLASELFIVLGILNVLASVFVVQAAENAAKIKESMNKASYLNDQVRLQSLDKLLRTLIHPGRTQSNPKDKNATEVARLIRTEYPEAAAKIPNLETQLVQFAKHIQDAKKIHQSAMDVYEAQEVNECRQLRNIPSAKTYMVDGNEQLLVDDVANASNSLMLALAPIGAAEIMLTQEQESLEILLEEARRVQEFVKSVICPNSDWTSTEGAGTSGNIWKASKGLCDEAYDPGPKGLDRIEQKVHGKYGGRYQRNRDYCRLSLIYKSVSHLIQAVPRFLEYQLSSDNMQVVSLENRFLQPHPLGWRDVTMLLKVRVPCSDYDPYPEESYHLMELQMRLKGLTDVCHQGHQLYEEIRASLPNDLVTTILDRLVTDTTLDLGITKSEWLQCLPNKSVRKLLDEIGIPRRALKSLFDIIDIDGSGTVTSSELTEMLRLVKDPVHAHELTGCHLRVRDIQRHMQTRLEPQLVSMHNFAIRCMETQEFLLESLLSKVEEWGSAALPKPSPSDPHPVARQASLLSLESIANVPGERRRKSMFGKASRTILMPTSIFVKEGKSARDRSSTDPVPNKRPSLDYDSFGADATNMNDYSTPEPMTPRLPTSTQQLASVPKSIPSMRTLTNKCTS